MSVQNTYLTALGQFREIGQDIDLDEEAVQRAGEFHGKIDQFQVLIPLVGSFNAGKTSLVNAYLEREENKALPTDIVPQTALATEIHSAASVSEERIELYGKDDQLLQRVDIPQFQQVEKETLKTGNLEAQYAKAMLHAAPLRDNDRKVLVDMPGLDSGLRTHNAAIQRYLPLGSYFILVVDAEHGALRDSEIRQLREFLDQEVEFAVLINKVDKKKMAAEAIAKHIEGQVRQEFGKAAAVRLVSAHESDVAAFQQIVEAVDFNQALCGYWRLRIIGLFDDAIRSLHTRYSALNVSSAESERMIAQLEEKKEALEEKFQEDEREIRGRYSDRAVNRIVREVRNTIRDNAPALVQAHQGGGREAFNQEINELVRQTLNRTVDEARSETLNEIAERYRADIGEIGSLHEQFVQSGGDAALKPEIAGLAKDASARSAKAFRTAASTISEAKNLSTVIGGVFAAVTNIVAPWLEVVIILLPSIFGFFSERRAEEQRQEQMQNQLRELQSQIGNVVAPKIASSLRGEISADYEKATQEMLAHLKKHVQGDVEQIQADINKSRSEIEEQRLEVEERRAHLRGAIDRLTEAKKPLEDN